MLVPDHDQEPDQTQAPKDDHFTESHFCQVHTPAPLGPDRDRFLRLIQDIRLRKDDYAAQLSSLTLAALSEKGKNQEGSHNDILGALRKPSSSASANDEALWQARLVLKIGEILDTEEDELNLQLAELSEQKNRLFNELQGDSGESGSIDSEDTDDDLFAEILEQQEQIGRPAGSTLRNRFRAWQKLYRAGVIPDQPSIWTTRCRESAEVIADRYETRSGRSIAPLLHLALPARLPGQGAEALISAFRTETGELRQTLRQKLQELAEGEELVLVEPTILLPEAEAYQEQWQAALDTHFPSARYGRLPLTVNLLANISLEQLLRDEGPVAQQTHGTHGAHEAVGHGLLAVIG